MGSHYIPVSGITIDTIKDAIADALPDIIDLDILCPAAGYDTTPPDPAIYCPANGYFPDESWQPPIDIIDPQSEQILLLVDDLSPSFFNLQITASAGSRRYEVLNPDMTVVSSVDSTSSSNTINLPTQNTGKNYIIRLTPAMPGEKILTFTTNDTPGFGREYRILQAKFYTPNINSLQFAFYKVRDFKKCEFLTDLNSLTTLSYAFAETGIESVVFPTEMNLCTNFTFTFQKTKFIKKVDMSAVNLPNLTTMASMFIDSNVRNILLPTELPELTTMQNFAQRAYQLESITFPASTPKLAIMSQAFIDCMSLRTLKLSPLPLLVNASSMCYGCESVAKIEFQGPSDYCNNFSSVGRNCYSLKEVIMPTSMNAMTNAWNYMLYNAPLIKLTIPLSMSAFTADNSYGWQGISSVLEDISTCNNWGSSHIGLSIISHRLKAFNQPTLKVSSLRIGTSAALPAQVESVEINWGDSDYSGIAPQIVIYGKLPSGEIDRIYTALPSVAKTIDVRYNPGFAGANHSIAQAKGWTVLGA